MARAGHGRLSSRSHLTTALARAAVALGLALVAALALAPPSMAHSERPTQFPDPDAGNFPQMRTTGPRYVVCRPDSPQRINAMVQDPVRRQANLSLFNHCQSYTVQRAVRESASGTRILVLPGVYPENPSKKGPIPPGCQDVYDATANGVFAISYEDQRRCPNAQNLIAILGDTNGDRVCDVKCNLQIQGTGDSPDDTVIAGDRAKLNVIRADRADGIYLKNFTVEKSDFNNIYFLETNGFRADTIVSRYSREYGILSFTSDHGIYENCETSYNGDSGVYPGSGPDRHGIPDIHGHVYGIEIRNCESHHNTLGYSGTAGNGIWVHNSRFHDNSTGIVTDSFVPGHPGMPQDHSKWSNNAVYSNNYDLYNAERDAYCQNTPAAQRDVMKVCPTFQAPIGTGMLIAGGDGNIIENNYFWDNWRRGTMLHWVPAALRGEEDASRNYDTSANNRYEGNCMSMKPADINNPDFTNCGGVRDPNGVDFWWDEEEGQDCDPNQAGCVDTDTSNGNCWSGNSGPGGATTSDPISLLLPACPGIDTFRPGNTDKQAFLVPCATWDPMTNPDPPGCDWFTVPPEPQ